jgi:hypothetical protein
MIAQATDAEFRAWGFGISQMLQACGLEKTTDTGQINWATVARPSGLAGTTVGYEIFRFTDPLQATRPIFIKVTYGNSSANAGAAALTVQVATATNGAGNLTGLASSSVQMQMNLASASPTPQYASGDGSSIALMTTASSAAGTAFTWHAGLFIERTRNADGTPNGDGLLVSFVNTVTNSIHQFMSFTLVTNSAQASGLAVPFASGRYTTHNAGTDITVYPAFAVSPKPQGQPLIYLGCALNEFPRLTTLSLMVAGVMRTYLAVTGTSGVRDNANAVMGLLMRYE